MIRKKPCEQTKARLSRAGVMKGWMQPQQPGLNQHSLVHGAWDG